MKTSILFISCICYLGTMAQVGNLDSTFGKNGIQTVSVNANNFPNLVYNPTTAMKILPVQTGGFFLVTYSRLVKFSAAGTVDSTFGTDGYSAIVPFQSMDAVLQADGKIVVVGGEFRDGHGFFAIARFNTAGFPDSTFDGDGLQYTASNSDNYGSGAEANSVAIQGNDIIVAGNTFDHIQGTDTREWMLTRYAENGSLQNKVVRNYTLSNDPPELGDIFIQEDKIVMAGVIDQRSAVVRLNEDFSTDNSFNHGAPFLGDYGSWFIAIAGDHDKLVLAGGIGEELLVVRLNNNGSLDNSFDDDGRVITNFGAGVSSTAYGLAVQNHKIIAGGTAGNSFALAVYKEDGSLDNSFSGDGKLMTSFLNLAFARAFTLAVQGNKIILAGEGLGRDNNVGRDFYDATIAQYNLDGSLDDAFSQDGLLTTRVPFTQNEFKSALVQADGKVVAVGSTVFPNYYNGVLLARLNSNGTLDPGFGVNGIKPTNIAQFPPGLRVVDAKLQEDKIVVLCNVNIFSLGKFMVLRFHSDGALDSSFGTNGQALSDFGSQNYTIAEALLFDGDKIVVVGRTGVPGTGPASSAIAIARFNKDGSPDTSFDQDGIVTTHIGPDSDDYGTAVAVQKSKLVVTGHTFKSYNASDLFVARYNADGSLDNSFNGTGIKVTDLGTFDYGFSLRILDSGIVVAGASDITSGSSTKFLLAHFRNDGSFETAFGNGGVKITDLPLAWDAKFAFQNNGKIIIGTELSPHPYQIVRYNEDGTRDMNFSIIPPFTTNNFVVGGNRLFAVGLQRLIQTGSQYSKAAIAAYLLEINNPITLSCPADKIVSTDRGVCTALVSKIGPFTAPSPDDTKVNYTLTGATTGSGVGSVSGLVFNQGVTTVTYSVINDPAETCTFNVTVQDREAPVITNVSATPTVLWPPNHKMREVEIKYIVRENCSGVITNLSVTSNEPQNGTGRNDVEADWQIVDANHVRLRAERHDRGNGRIYTITITARDASGNVGSQYVTVTVPPSQGQHRQSFTDDGKIESLKVTLLSNPSSSYFTLLTSSAGNMPLTLRITNAVGSVIETRTGLPANGQLQVGNNYKDGFYVAELTQGTQKVLVRLVKLR